MDNVSAFEHGQSVYLITDPTFELQVISILIDMNGQLRYQVFPGIKDKHFFYADQLTTEADRPKRVEGLKKDLQK